MSLSDWITNSFYNDTANIQMYLIVFGTAALVMIAATFFHELGHLIYFKMNLKKNARIYFRFNSIWKFCWEAGNKEDYIGITRKQNHDLLLCGVLMGIVPILLATMIWNFYILLLIPYSAGAWQDIKNMAELGEYTR